MDTSKRDVSTQQSSPLIGKAVQNCIGERTYAGDHSNAECNTGNEHAKPANASAKLTHRKR